MGAQLLLQLEHAVFAHKLPFLCQLAVCSDETSRMRHGQLVAVSTSVAPMTHLTTHPTIRNSLRVAFPEIRGVRQWAFAVAIAAGSFIPSVAALTKRHVLTGFKDMDSHEVVRMGHLRAVTVGAKA